MADTLELFSRPRRAAPGGLGRVHDSGGERSSPHRHRRPGRSAAGDSYRNATRDRLSEILDPGLEPDNPVDAWGTGREAATVFQRVADSTRRAIRRLASSLSAST